MTITGTGFNLIGRVDIVDNTALDVNATVAITGVVDTSTVAPKLVGTAVIQIWM